jgi:hypothetical protein
MVGRFAVAGVALLAVAVGLFAIPASAGSRATHPVTRTFTEADANFAPSTGAMTCPVTVPSFCSAPTRGNDVVVRVDPSRSFSSVTEVDVTASVRGLGTGALVLLGSGVVGRANVTTGAVHWKLSIANGNIASDIDRFARTGTFDLFVTPGRAHAVAAVRVTKVAFRVTGG